ncbi:MAG: hypothetical protein ACE5HS_13905 [bacterium]
MANFNTGMGSLNFMEKKRQKLQAGQNNYDIIEEKISLTAYHSSESLKHEIGKIIQYRTKMNWDFVNINSRGPFIYLIFKQRANCA